MNIDEFFKVFTGGNSNVATWTPKAIKEFAEDYHNQQLRLHGVTKQSELLLSELVEWLVINTNLDMEKVADFEERFKK